MEILLYYTTPQIQEAILSKSVFILSEVRPFFLDNFEIVILLLQVVHPHRFFFNYQIFIPALFKKYFSCCFHEDDNNIK